ncbi:MAG: PTS sugar transporter subunit IIA [Acidobacteriota bacterium]
MFLFQHLTPERVLIDPVATGRDQLFSLFGERFEDLGLVSSGAAVERSLKEREAILSTGIGGGWAIPHAQIPGVGRLLMAASVHPRGLDFPAVDQLPVQLVFCLIGDSKTAADHLAGLARLARLARQADALERLVAASTSEDFIAILKAIEEG